MSQRCPRIGLRLAPELLGELVRGVLEAPLLPVADRDDDAAEDLAVERLPRLLKAGEAVVVELEPLDDVPAALLVSVRVRLVAQHENLVVNGALVVAAMTALGGDIVVGADGRGKPTGMVTQGLAQVYDEASLRLILRGYLPPELRIHSQTHVVDGKEVIVVRVEAAAGGPVALTKDGVYRDANNQPVYEFRAGERYIRDGTSNRLFVGDAHQIGLLLMQRTVAPPATDPAESMSFAVAPAVLAAAAQQLLRQQDDVPLRALLGSLDADLRGALGQGA